MWTNRRTFTAIGLLAVSLMLAVKSGGSIDRANAAHAQDAAIAAPTGAENSAAGIIGRNTIADIASRVAPAVVNIENEAGIPGNVRLKIMINGKELHPGDPGFPSITPFGGGMLHVPNTGSGVIVRPDGYILTNAHVVNGNGKLTVKLNDGRSFPGKVVGVDSFSDLAVVKIDGRDLPAAHLGTSANLRPGDFVVAIGNPFGFDHSVTFGIISAVKRSVTDVNGNINFIQTDAAINPGNSGGPLLNLDGDVIGIDTAIKTNAQNIGFAIPVDVAKDVSEGLIANKKIQRPWIGMAMKPVDENMAKSLGLPGGTQGVLVAGVMENGPAKLAGLRAGDVILKIDGQDMKGPQDLRDYVRSHKTNDLLHIYLLRSGAPQAVVLNVGQYPDKIPELVGQREPGPGAHPPEPLTPDFPPSEEDNEN